ncbi:MAG TPA: DUF1549 and DUF1553 domain-containing protein [Terracidiphilus sp.]|nr:conserved exported hypothetical protein [Candidatus Sulfopaludibacter sp. SbA4]HXR39795.1 DUF1549 and DUF1553 domain-containing protein [Terracidiphilus sp.]
MRRVCLFVCICCTILFAADTFTARQREFWSFQKPKEQNPPVVAHKSWARTPIDNFILAKLEAKGVTPASPADKISLLRRASLDLIGLPPTPEEVDAFLDDRSPQAFEKVVDRLLASPQYGERWGRHWLDLARFAESEGFKADEIRPNAWRYRDYVIQSFNQDKPYNRFVEEQIAGDELWPGDPQALVATGFNRSYPDESNARILQQRRQELLDDITDTTGAVFLGLTYGCARCHNHKFDPILQSDYYRLQAFFANTAASDHIPMLPADKLADYRRRKALWEQQTAEIRAKIAALVDPQKQRIASDYFEKYPPEIQAMILKPGAQRSPYEWQMWAKANPYLQTPDADAAKQLPAAQKAEYASLNAELAKFDDLKPADPPEGMGLADLGRNAPATHVLAVGVYDAPREEVEPGFLTLLDPAPAKISAPQGVESTGRRTALAHWLTGPDNPLTARVMVNRIWQHHFGRGIVGTPSDFGIMGERPSHPELLDWLAREFVRSGWSMKHMHRLIMTSAVYQQSTSFNKEAAQADPGNRLLWAFPRQRLEGEVIRDASLLVSGTLNLTAGGPSVFPDLPEGMGALRGGWKLSAPDERSRRSVYIFVKRNTRYPMMEIFDMPDTHESCSRREITTTAPQALTMLNDKVTLEWAQAFAARALAAQDPVDRAYRLAYSRSPDPWEKDTVATFFHKQKAITAERAAKGEKLALPPSMAEGTDPAYAAAFVDFCQMLLNSNEFVYGN